MSISFNSYHKNVNKYYLNRSLKDSKSPEANSSKSCVNYENLPQGYYKPVNYKNFLVSFGTAKSVDKKYEEFDPFFQSVDKYEWTPEDQTIRLQKRKEKLDTFFHSIKDSEKSDFVDYYMKTTDFPKLNDVSTKMEKHSIKKLEEIAAKNGFEILWAGYCGSCSTAKGVSFPGSDIDGLRAIIKPKHQEDITSQVKKAEDDWKFGLNRNIVSCYHPYSSPRCFEIESLTENLKKVDEVVSENPEIRNKFEKYELNMNKYNTNKCAAAEFNVDIANNLDYSDCKTKDDVTKKQADLMDAVVTIEMLRDGRTLKESPEFKKYREYINNSALFKYSNYQEDRHFQTSDKPKILKRRDLQQKFEEMDATDKFEFIKSIIYYSFNLTQDNKFKTYFTETAENNDERMKLIKAINPEIPLNKN